MIMIAWLTANLGTILITAAIAAVVVLVIVSMVKNRKKGGGGCSGNCANCHMHDGCR